MTLFQISFLFYPWWFALIISMNIFPSEKKNSSLNCWMHVLKSSNQSLLMLPVQNIYSIFSWTKYHNRKILSTTWYKELSFCWFSIWILFQDKIYYQKNVFRLGLWISFLVIKKFERKLSANASITALIKHARFCLYNNSSDL